MESAVLKIFGDIGESNPMMDLMGETEMISAKTVADFLDAHKEASEITVRINSRGGSVQDGWGIYDLLTTSGKKIKTVAESKVYSIATIIFLAGSEREIMQNADGLIHNPFIPEYTLADQYEADDLLKIAEGLKQEEAKILDFYVSRTGADETELAKLMQEDTKLSAEDMLRLGFATKIVEPIKAYAYINPKNSYTMTENDVKTFGQKIDAILAKISNLSRVAPVDQTLKDKDGNEFKLDKESGSPAVGDTASPDGTYAMEDGKTITISGGKVTEIKEPETAKSELELANEKIAELQASLEAANAKAVAAEKEKPDLVAAETEMKAKIAEASGLVTELSNLKNSWKPEGRTKFSSSDKVGDIDLNQVRELKEKLNSKNK
jgi:ATP-dependent Clp protease protease subunit